MPPPRQRKRGRLPHKKNLMRYSRTQLIDLMKRMGLEPDYGALRRSIRYYLSQYVGVQGADPDLQEHIRTQVKNRTKRWLVDQARDAMSQYRWKRLKQYGQDSDMRWVSVSDGGTCESCEKRHNRIEKLRVWQLIGRPGSRQLRCGARCRCRLIRASTKRRDV